MNCTEVQELLSAYHDGELPPGEAAQVAVHVADCSFCVGELGMYERLTGLSRQLADPPVPTQMWEELQSKLGSPAESTTILARLLPSRGPGRVLALAATILVAVGVGVIGYEAWFSKGYDRLAVNFAHYLDEFVERPDDAQQFLLAKYGGRPIAIEEAVNLVGYEPLAAKGLPPGYSLDKAYLLNMPCCTCAQIVCQNKEGQSIAIMEHDADQPVWFGDRSAVRVRCCGKPTQIVELDDGRLAATWPSNERNLTIIGARDVEEVEQLVSYLGHGQDM